MLWEQCYNLGLLPLFRSRFSNVMGLKRPGTPEYTEKFFFPDSTLGIFQHDNARIHWAQIVEKEYKTSFSQMDLAPQISTPLIIFGMCWSTFYAVVWLSYNHYKVLMEIIATVKENPC